MNNRSLAVIIIAIAALSFVTIILLNIEPSVQTEKTEYHLEIQSTSNIKIIFTTETDTTYAFTYGVFKRTLIAENGKTGITIQIEKTQSVQYPVYVYIKDSEGISVYTETYTEDNIFLDFDSIIDN